MNGDPIKDPQLLNGLSVEQKKVPVSMNGDPIKDPQLSLALEQTR